MSTAWRTRPGPPRGRDAAPRRQGLATPLYQAFAAMYLAGLVIWLALGVIPPLADALSPVHHALASLAAGDGVLAEYAARITDHTMAREPTAWISLMYLFSGLNIALGVVLLVKRPDGPVPRLLALAVMGTAATFNEPSHEVFHILGEPPAIRAVHFVFHVLSGVTYLWAVVLFPSGASPLNRPLRPLLARAVVVTATATVATVCWRSSFIAHPPFFVAFFGVLIPLVGICAQTVQLRRRRGATSDEQSRLLRVALLPALGVAIVWLAAQGAARLGESRAAAEITTGAQHVFPAVFAVVPVMMFVAIVRHKLWDIDAIASRVLLISLLATFIGAVYLSSIAFAGWLLRGSGWAVLAPLVIVACLAESVRERLTRLSNRLVFGQHLSPREAVSSLVDRFSGSGDSDELDELARVVVASTRAASASIWLMRDSELLQLVDHPRTAPRPRQPQVLQRLPLGEPTWDACRAALAPARCWPVSFDGSVLGVLAVSTPRGVQLTGTEVHLLDDLSHHAGLLVANAQLTVDLARELEVVTSRATQLRESRRLLVAAQDEQRSRLEKDIHDGAQQHLVALLIQLRALSRQPEQQQQRDQLTRLRPVLTQTQATLARLAAGGAPPILVESGLRAALEVAAAPLRQAGTTVRLTLPASQRFDEADVETTALYFCCVEAMQNAAKHARAGMVQIAVESAGDLLSFVVADNGVGFSAEASTGGSGLRNLGGRLTALGGSVTVESQPGHGTTVRGWVPLTRSLIPLPRQPVEVRR